MHPKDYAKTAANSSNQTHSDSTFREIICWVLKIILLLDIPKKNRKKETNNNYHRKFHHFKKKKNIQMCPFLPKTHLSSPSFHPRGLQRAGERQRPSSGIHPHHRRSILQQPRDPRRQRPRRAARRLQVARSAAARGFPVGALDTMTPQRGFFRGVVFQCFN